MRTRIVYTFIFVLVAMSFAVGVYVYPVLPERVASHWNAAGKADDTMGRFWGVFLFPILMASLATLFALLPRLDPLRANIEKFRADFDRFALGFVPFLIYFYGLTLAWNLGRKFEFGRFAAPGIGVLVYGVGVLLGRIRRNWFIGIRTPWTLLSDSVWEKTHRQGARVFKVAGLIACFGLRSRALQSTFRCCRSCWVRSGSWRIHTWLSVTSSIRSEPRSVIEIERF